MRRQAGASAPAGLRNSITAQQDGCIVQEQYTTPGGFTGMNINFYDSARQVWHQTWMSNQGGMLYLEGGINADGAMEMSDRNLPGATPGTINRTIWTPLPEGDFANIGKSPATMAQHGQPSSTAATYAAHKVESPPRRVLQ